MKRAGIASFVVGAMLAVFFVVLIVQNMPNTPKPLEHGLARLSTKGLTIWSSESRSRASCKVRTTAGAEVLLERQSGSETFEIDGVAWYLIARSAEVVPAGDYLVDCSEADSDATYAVARRSSFGATMLSVLGLIATLLIFTALGTILCVLGGRRRKPNPNLTFRPIQPGYQQPGPPPGYQQPGRPPGYPRSGGPQDGPYGG
ncbi:hypothetical protein [Kribbella sp. NPDC051718]|uniref:hypothetical protein n=1 Tax=Kribbella sp. NPDC051718 TaxID=3155168 RepID=UPI003418A5EE